MSSMAVMSVDGVLLPLEEKSDKEFRYLELVGSNVIPVGAKDGGCDTKVYKVIELSSSGYACVVPNDILQKKRSEFSIYSKRSMFNKLLEQTSPDEVYLVLLTRPSSFQIYHDVARKAKSAGFEIGWTPFDEDKPLTFSPNGRRIGTQ